MMNLSSNVLPSIAYSTGSTSKLSIDVQPSRIISGRFRIRPKSQYERKLLNAALMQTNTGIVLNQNSSQSFTIGGVQVLNHQLSNLTTGPTEEAGIASSPTDLRYSTSHLESLQAYRLSNQQSPTNIMRRERSASMSLKRSTADQRDTKVVENSTSEQFNISKGRNAILHTRNHTKTIKNVKLKLRKNSNGSERRQSTDNRKPDFITSNAKATKIFLSQKQSADINISMERGAGPLQPSAPPCTPSLEMLKKYDYVPSLSDNMAKQQVKSKLKVMKKVESAREKVKQAGKMKLELKEAKDREQELRKQQRRAIYALNSVMTKVENDQFERFKADRGLKPKEYPSNGKLR